MQGAIVYRVFSFLSAVLFCLGLAACTPRMDLHTGMTEADANEILSALLTAGIPAEKRAAKEGVAVTVPAPHSAEALSILQAQGLPRIKQNGMGQVFRKDSLISSPLEERVRYLYALSQELERTLATMDGVVTARVHIVLPERLVPGEPIVPSSAAVFIKHQPDISFSPHLSKIRSLVFNSIPGLSGDVYEKVTVVAMPAVSATPVSTQLVSLGPVTIDASSRDLMVGWLIGMAFLWVISLAGMYFVLRRQWRTGGLGTVKPKVDRSISEVNV